MSPMRAIRLRMVCRCTCSAWAAGSVGLQEGAQCGEELLGLIGGIERAEDGIGVTLQDCAGNMREDEPATGHIGCHDHFVAQSAHGKRRSGLAETPAPNCQPRQRDARPSTAVRLTIRGFLQWSQHRLE